MATPVKDIDKGWAWLVLLASYINLLLCSGLAFVAGMFQLVFLEKFQGSVAFTSWITALFSSFMQIGGPLSSAMSNNFSCRTSVMVGGAMMSVGMFVSSLADSLELLFVSFGLVAGIGLGLIYTSSVVVLNYFFVERRTLVTGIALSASGLGIAICPQVSRFLFDTFTWREALVITSAAAAQMCVTGALMSSIHEPKRRRAFNILRKVSPCCKRNGKTNFASEFKEADEALMQLRTQVISGDEEMQRFTTTANHQTSNSRLKEDSGPLVPSCHSSSENCARLLANKNSHVDSNQPNLQANAGKRSSESDSLCMQNAPSIHIDRAPDVETSSNSFPLCLFGSYGDIRKNQTGKSHYSGSHQELTSKSRPKNGGAPTFPSYAQSHQDLLKWVVSQHVVTRSNPNLIRKETIAKSGNVHTVTKTSSQNPDKVGSLDQVMVVSRNPSLLGLIPTLSSLEIVVPAAGGGDLQSNTSLHSYSLLEGKVMLTEILPAAESVKAISGSVKTISGSDSEDTDPAVEVVVARRFPPLYRNKAFWIICFSLFAQNMGIGIFIVHLPSFADKRGFTDQELTNVLSTHGFAILFGRILCGALANAVPESSLLIWWGLLVIGGVFEALVPIIAQNYISFVVVSYCLGNCQGTVYAVLSSLTIEMVGLNSLATAFGLEMISAGLGYFISPPLAGVLVDLTKTYDDSMVIGGVLMSMAGMSVFLIPLLGLHYKRVDKDDVIQADIEIDLERSSDNDERDE